MKVTLRRAMPVLAAAGVSLFAAAPAGAAGTAGSGPATQAGTSAAAAGAEAGIFYGVAATSSRDAWAVGESNLGTYLIMRWNGSRWSVSHYGHGQAITEFGGVAATSATNVWAVGSTTAIGGKTHTLAEHWNGKIWKYFYSPTPGGTGKFTGVAATSAGNAWAVGVTGPGSGKPLIEHWNGKSWTQARYPAPAGAELDAVTATSASNAWAVGSTRATHGGKGQKTLIEHWNGSTWTRVTSPNAADAGSLLQGVTATSPDNAWAVGFSLGSTTYEPLIERWNGAHWSRVHSPNPTGDTDLSAVSAASSTDAWAVGYTNPTRCGNSGPVCGTAAFHWNGKKWTATASINPPVKTVDEFAGVAVTSTHNAWAVGSSDWGATLIEHWNGKAWVWRPPA
jgi:hypothetical protein